MSHFFISFDTQDAQSERCASWLASKLSGAEVVVPQKSWALGSWTGYLQHVMHEAERIIVILSPGYLTTTDSFVQYQRMLVQQVPSRLLVVCVGDGRELLSEQSVFYNVPCKVDFTPVFEAEECFLQRFFEGIRQTA